MITLAFEGTAKVASVAVYDGRLLGMTNIDNGLTQSELLLPMAEALLRSLHLTFSDVELLTTTVGPGSFTGVRIGVSLIKGIALGRTTPCVAVSTIDSLAQNLSDFRGIIIPVMDARRGQFYTAIFKNGGDGLIRITEDMALSAKDIAEKLAPFADEKIYLVGDGYEPAKAALDALGIKTEITPSLLRPENAHSCAIVAAKKYERGEYVTDLEIAPTYLRLPQAERERLEKEKLN